MGVVNSVTMTTLQNDLCGALSEVDSGCAVHLALCLLLNHRRHVEAIGLAKKKDKTCPLARSLANSGLLQPSLASMCSEELIQNTREEQTGVCKKREGERAEGD